MNLVPHWIDGAADAGSGPDRLAVTDPATGAEIAAVAIADATDVDRAVGEVGRGIEVVDFARKDSLFGDLHMHGADGVRFFTRTKAVTERWPDPHDRGTHLDFPTTT